MEYCGIHHTVPSFNLSIFWAAGKNHVALQHKYDKEIYDVISDVQEGWYGNVNNHPAYHPLHKCAVDCQNL